LNAQENKLIDCYQRAHEIADALVKPALQPRAIRRYLQPMSFTKTEQGEFKIEKTAPSITWEVASLRHMIFLKVRHTKITFKEPKVFHKLVGPQSDGATPGVLTSDLPIEIYSQFIEFRKCHGKVLVGGLGIGMAAWMIQNLPKVTTVTVVEQSQDIIDLIQHQIPSKIKIVKDDLFNYLEHSAKSENYDSAYFDIWYGTGESCWVDNVVPLYRLSRAAGIKGYLGAWGESEMRGQLISSLYMHAKIDTGHAWKPYKVFVEGVRRKYGDAPTDEQIKRMIQLYITKIGTQGWEKTFKWI
jgi:hypothetical protein